MFIYIWGVGFSVLVSCKTETVVKANRFTRFGKEKPPQICLSGLINDAVAPESRRTTQVNFINYLRPPSLFWP